MAANALQKSLNVFYRKKLWTAQGYFRYVIDQDVEDEDSITVYEEQLKKETPGS